jgi:rhodanese-related sulfurtransferase
VDQLRVVDPVEARRLILGGAVVLDVRSDDEWAAGRIAGSLHVPLAELPDHLDEVPAGATVVCVCHSGARSRRAAIFLGECGVDALNLEGGVAAWVETGGTLERDSDETGRHEG